ncbi:MAG: archaellin/type IV pilin N-terminal domain-containing protein [Candidatus Hodarchaeales archaeon]|jgi:hypothetical protein
MYKRQLIRRARAVSPVIAAILLIGLAVLAGAAVAFIVLPMLSSTTGPEDMNVELSGTSITVNDTITDTANSYKLTFKITVSNKGTADTTITGIQYIIGTVTQPTKTATGVTFKAGSKTAPITIKAGSAETIDMTIDFSTGGFPASLSDDLTLYISYGDPVNSEETYLIGTIS